MLEYLIHVEGLVQGVGYRAFARREAVRLGIGGYAKNLGDGGVEILAQGTEDRLDLLVDRLREGPRLAEVEEITVTRRPVEHPYQAFEVL